MKQKQKLKEQELELEAKFNKRMEEIMKEKIEMKLELDKLRSLLERFERLALKLNVTDSNVSENLSPLVIKKEIPVYDKNETLSVIRKKTKPRIIREDCVNIHNSIFDSPAFFEEMINTPFHEHPHHTDKTDEDKIVYEQQRKTDTEDTREWKECVKLIRNMIPSISVLLSSYVFHITQPNMCIATSNMS